MSDRGLLERVGDKWRERRDPVRDWVDDPWDDPATTYYDSLELMRRRSKVIPRIAFGVVVVLIAATLAAGAVGWWYLRQIRPPGEVGSARQFEIVEGDTLEGVSHRLEEQGFIVNAGVFEYYVKEHGGLEFVPGSYTLRPKDHVGNLMRVLSTPPSEQEIKITFPEGYTLQQMARRVAEQIPTMTAEGFLAAVNEHMAENSFLPPGATSMEGVLFPNTYFVTGSESESHLVDRLEAEMLRVANQLNFAPGTPGEDPYQTLIVASMIEKEAKVDADRARIAAVIQNRRILQTPLQIDATLLYGRDLAGLDPSLGPSALRDIDTPYNTYMHVGLPPTPIANPGRDSIEAALNPNPAGPLNPNDPLCKDVPPEEQPCMLRYYVAIDKEGHHAFAATYAQHLANIEIARAAGVFD